MMSSQQHYDLIIIGTGADSGKRILLLERGDYAHREKDNWLTRAVVLGVNCKAHDLDNLYVVDGSFFVSGSAVNPALTIMVNTLRVGDHLRQRLQ